MLLETHTIWSFQKLFLIRGIRDALKCNRKASGRLKVHDWTYVYELKTITEIFQYFQGNIHPLSQSSTSSALDQRHWQCATQIRIVTGIPVTERPYFRLWDFKSACMLLKKLVFEASLCTHAPAAASDIRLRGPWLGSCA